MNTAAGVDMEVPFACGQGSPTGMWAQGSSTEYVGIKIQARWPEGVWDPWTEGVLGEKIPRLADMAIE